MHTDDESDSDGGEIKEEPEDHVDDASTKSEGGSAAEPASKIVKIPVSNHIKTDKSPPAAASRSREASVDTPSSVNRNVSVKNTTHLFVDLLTNESNQELCQLTLPPVKNMR